MAENMYVPYISEWFVIDINIRHIEKPLQRRISGNYRVKIIIIWELLLNLDLPIHETLCGPLLDIAEYFGFYLNEVFGWDIGCRYQMDESFLKPFSVVFFFSL